MAMAMAAVAIGAMLPSDVAASPAGLAVPAVRDNTLFESEAGDLSSGMGPAIFAGDNATLNTRRALLYFDGRARFPPEAPFSTRRSGFTSPLFRSYSPMS